MDVKTNSTLNATQKAGITETLFALSCLLGSSGNLSLATPFVDDEGVDIIVYRRKVGGPPLYIQVKSRFTLTGRGQYRAQVRKQSFLPRKDLYIVFVYFDTQKIQLGETLWFIPSLDFKKLISGQGSNRKNYVFSTKFNSRNDMWAQYKLKLSEISSVIESILNQN